LNGGLQGPGKLLQLVQRGFIVRKNLGSLNSRQPLGGKGVGKRGVEGYKGRQAVGKVPVQHAVSVNKRGIGYFKKPLAFIVPFTFLFCRWGVFFHFGGHSAQFLLKNTAVAEYLKPTAR
jgi:hypothetical protein